VTAPDRANGEDAAWANRFGAEWEFAEANARTANRFLPIRSES